MDVSQGKKLKTFDALSTVSGSPGQGRTHLAANWISSAGRFTDGSTGLITSSYDGTDIRTGIMLESGEALTSPSSSGRLVGAFGPVAGFLGGSQALALLSQLIPDVGTAKGAGLAAILAGPPAALNTLAITGQAAPGFPNGMNFRSFQDPLHGRSTVFLARVQGSGISRSTDTALYIKRLNGVELLARAGTDAADVNLGARWRAFESVALGPEATGPIVFATLLPDKSGVDQKNNVGLWGTDSAGSLRKLLRQREVIGGRTVRSFSCLKAVNGSPGVSRSFNASGNVVVSRALFTDGSTGIVRTEVP